VAWLPTCVYSDHALARRVLPLVTVVNSDVTDNRPTFPDFDAPPLVETVLGIQFEPLFGLDLLELGRLWARLRDTYPKHEIHPILAAQFETFERPVLEELLLPLGLNAPPARCWFLTPDDTELVQVQPDRFLLNWRKRSGKGDYPRYEAMRARLLQALAKFQAFVESESLGEIAPNQCEVTYVNHMEQGKGWTAPSDVARVFPGFSGRWSAGFLPDPEDVRAALRFVIPGPDGKPIGRLHAQLEPRYRRQDGAPLLALTLTARLRPMTADLAGAVDSLNLGREWIVRGFTSLTSKGMHDLWERRDA
jgi:uncharacterized protein (TIGR04255 family)